jgi:hypothetical protein
LEPLEDLTGALQNGRGPGRSGEPEQIPAFAKERERLLNLRLASSANETGDVRNLDVWHSWFVDAASVAEARHLHRVVA